MCLVTISCHMREVLGKSENITEKNADMYKFRFSSTALDDEDLMDDSSEAVALSMWLPLLLAETHRRVLITSNTTTHNKDPSHKVAKVTITTMASCNDSTELNDEAVPITEEKPSNAKLDTATTCTARKSEDAGVSLRVDDVDEDEERADANKAMEQLTLH